MATSPDGQLTFEQVLERVLAADPESFYTQAQAFDEAAKTLHDAKNLLSKHRRTLEDAWANDAEQRFIQLDGLVRHLEVLLGDVPTYPGMLRRIGDAIVDSRQRLLELQHMPPDADKKATSDRDKQARKILDDLSGTYRRVGGEMPELPERTASGQMLTAPPPPRHAVEFGNATGGGAGCAPIAAKSAHSLMSRTAAPAVHEPVKEAAAPAPQAAFGRFAQYATRPAASTAPAPKARSFNGFARLTDQADPAALALRPGGTNPAAADAPGQRERRHAETAEVPVELDRSTNVSTVDAVAPVKLESSPVAAPSPAAATAPTTSAAPESAQTVRPHISLTSTLSLASVPAAPSAPPVAAPPAPTAPPAIPATSGPPPNPLAVSAHAHLAPDSAADANMMRPSMGGAVAPGVSGPVGRGSEVWLRGDSTEWTATHQAAAQPGRDGTRDHRLGFTGDRNAAEQGEDAR
ncbi:hypothetical protein [Lentzea kentuckyensis]|uniref:hypothetical protein n=1 Tax=Lentzea kentuckyensis TaxID=360086 RepID=UPI000A3BCEE1|nr:hypothetical protein [Lentzea kentuckyensis]